MDYESTHSPSRSRYVPKNVRIWPIDPVECLEARAEQPSVVMTQMPVVPAIPPDLRLSTKRGRGFNRDQTILSQDDSVNTTNDCDIRVCIEQSVVLDTKVEDGDSVERDVYASQKSTWDRGYAV